MTLAHRILRIASLSALLGLALTMAPAQAGMTIRVTDSATLPGGSGTFDVVLDVDGTSVDVGAFSLELSIDPALAMFTGVTILDGAATAYVFGTLQLDDLTVPGTTFPDSGFSAQDLYLESPGFVSLSPGVYGLARVSYTIQPGVDFGTVIAVGLSRMIDTQVAFSQILDVDGNDLGATLEGGSITAVPEPASLVMSALGGLGLLLARRRDATR